MTDNLPPDRAEQAFRDAFATHADDVPFVPLTVPRRPARHWGPYLAVAASILLVAVIGTVLVRPFGSGTTATSGVAPAAAPETGQADAQAERATVAAQETTGSVPSAAGGAATPAPMPGWRFESYKNLLFQVPESWGYAPAINSDWCAADPTPRPARPFVDIARVEVPVRAVACPSAIPADRLAMHLTFVGERSQELPYALPAGWTMTQSTHEWTTVRIIHPDSQAALANQILASIQEVGTEHNGCPVASRIQSSQFVTPDAPGPQADVRSLDAIAVCQYEVSATGPGLAASTRLTGAAAATWLAALQASPTPGGPDDPSACSDKGPTGTALVVRIEAGGSVREVFVYYTSCVHNGFFDGSEARALNRAACVPLFAEPIWVGAGYGPSLQQCLPAQSPTPSPSR